MSHASVLVALSAEDLKAANNDLKAAIAYQMEPFDEGGEYFANGSRWDWWQIGGRFSGKFAPPDYDPHTDPTNSESCWVCRGTGCRDDAIGCEARKADPAYTCNGCCGTRRMLKPAGDWRDVGNTARRDGLTEENLRERRRADVERWWQGHLEERAKGWGGADKDLTKEQYFEKYAVGFACYAFLRDREWHEQERLGWFGGSAKTECELKAEKQGEEFTGRCLHTDERTGAKIVDWTGPKDSEERWNRLFWARFLRDLPGDTLLVVVDFHV